MLQTALVPIFTLAIRTDVLISNIYTVQPAPKRFTLLQIINTVRSV